jgi:protein-S-isoprenylcysteine O-methyltransferase Ste14
MTSTLLVRVAAIFRTALFALIFMGTTGIYMPRYFHLLDGPFDTNDWRALGWIPLVAGGFIALSCAFAFAWTGLGTPAPFDAPRRLVVTGLYRHVRNPMYLGMAIFMIGEWLLWGSRFPNALIYLGAYAACVLLFVLLYEEPTLRGKFPENYREYFRNVPRFLPRIRPWQPSSDTKAHAATS